MEHRVEGHGVIATARRDPVTGNVTVSGRITLFNQMPQSIEWVAAAPVTRGISFSGSGQPYPNRHIAMEGTPNKGNLESRDGRKSMDSEAKSTESKKWSAVLS